MKTPHPVCQDCGAHLVSLTGGKSGLVYECGTYPFSIRSGRCYENELEQLRNQVAELDAKLKAAEEWKAVVLSKVDGGNSGGLNPYVDRWSIDLPFEHEGKRFDEVDFKEAFDQAVQKEMT